MWMLAGVSVANYVTVGKGVSTGQNGIYVSYDNKAVANDNTYGSATLDSSGLVLNVINDVSKLQNDIILTNRDLTIQVKNDPNYGNSQATYGVLGVDAAIEFTDGTLRHVQIDGQTLTLSNTQNGQNEITTLNNQGYQLQLPADNKQITLEPSGLTLLDGQKSLYLEGGLVYNDQNNNHQIHLTTVGVSGSDGTNTYSLGNSGLSTKDSNGKIDLESTSSGVALVLDDNTDISRLTPKTLELKNGGDTADLSTTQLILGQVGNNVTLSKAGLVANEGSNSLSLTKNGVEFSDGTDFFELKKSLLKLKDGSKTVDLDATSGLETVDGTKKIFLNPNSIGLFDGDDIVTMSADSMSISTKSKDMDENDVTRLFQVINDIGGGIASEYQVKNETDVITETAYSLNSNSLALKSSENEKVNINKDLLSLQSSQNQIATLSPGGLTLDDNGATVQLSASKLNLDAGTNQNVDISKDGITLVSSETQEALLSHLALSLNNNGATVQLSASGGLLLDTGADQVLLDVNELTAPKAAAILLSVSTGSLDATDVLVQKRRYFRQC